VIRILSLKNLGAGFIFPLFFLTYTETLGEISIGKISIAEEISIGKHHLL